MNELQLMWNYVSNNIADDTAKSALADKCQEHGLDDTVIGIRWCIKYKRWPRKYIGSLNQSSYYFSNGGSITLKFKNFKNIGNNLPQWFTNFGWRNGIQLNGNTTEECITQLGRLVLKLKEAVNV